MAFRNYHGSDRSSAARVAMTGGGLAVKRIGQPIGTGEQGPAGPAGPAGEKGEKGDTGDVGPMGPAGQDGAGTIDVGTTTTLPAGSSAYVTNVGTSQNAILNFGIPQGQDGGGGGYGIEEAPMDGTTYGRNNGSWTPVSSGGGGSYGIEEAPTDGGIYARQNGTWVQIG